MGNLSWFREAGAHDAVRRSQDVEFDQVFNSYRHRVAYGGWDGGRIRLRPTLHSDLSIFQ